MQNRGLVSNLGVYVYAAGAIFLGLAGLASGDFAALWQRPELSAPGRHQPESAARRGEVPWPLAP